VLQWKNKYGGMQVEEARRLRALEDENARLKRVVAEQAVQIQILKEVNAKKKHHLTFALWSPRVIENFTVRLGKFVVWKNCFQIPIDRELVKDFVRAD
jgi:Transposase